MTKPATDPPVTVPEPGEPGVPGEPGKPTGLGGDGGRGGKGGRGAKGEPGVGWSDKAMMFLVAVLTVVFGFLFIRVSINQNEIHQERYESCLGGRMIVEQYNQQQEDIARILRANPDLPGSEDFARIYEAGQIEVPECGADPSEN